MICFGKFGISFVLLLGLAFAPLCGVAQEQDSAEAVRIAGAQPKKYSGPRISINYKGDVRTLLHLLAEELGLNAVISETVVGTITLVLKDMHADQALDIVLGQKGLGMRINGNVILLMPREELAVRDHIMEETPLPMEELVPLQTESFQLNYLMGSEVTDILLERRILSKRGSVVVDPRSNVLFVHDRPDKLEEVRKLVAQMDDVPPRSVLIEARIIEAPRDFGQQIEERLRLPRDKNAADDDAKGKAEIRPSFLFANQEGTRLLNMATSVLERDGKGHIVANPRRLSNDGDRVLVEQGWEVPCSPCDDRLSDVVWAPTLEITPRITPDGKIAMNIDARKNSRSKLLPGEAAMAFMPIQADILVDNGGTMVIGGLCEMLEQNDAGKTPDKNPCRLHENMTLLVFITSRIVRLE